MAINLGRVILGGLAAGAVRLVGEGVIRPILGERVQAELSHLNPALLPRLAAPSTLVAGVTINLLLGIAVVFIYAAIRPRFGAGLGTAVRAGLTLWAVASLAYFSQAVLGFFSWQFLFTRTAMSLVSGLVAACVGAALYKEAERISIDEAGPSRVPGVPHRLADRANRP